MTEIFISYKKEDVERVEPIARSLANAGYSVWWDHRIPPGSTYRDIIGAALQQAKCVIVVWSEQSITSQWVLDEADEGKQRGVLLPVLIDAVEPPYGFRQVEAADLTRWSGDTSHSEWTSVLDSVSGMVGRSPGGPPQPFATPSALTPASTRSHAQALKPSHWIGRAAMGASALALAIAGAWLFFEINGRELPRRSVDDPALEPGLVESQTVSDRRSPPETERPPDRPIEPPPPMDEAGYSAELFFGRWDCSDHPHENPQDVASQYSVELLPNGEAAGDGVQIIHDEGVEFHYHFHANYAVEGRRFELNIVEAGIDKAFVFGERIGRAELDEMNRMFGEEARGGRDLHILEAHDHMFRLEDVMGRTECRR